MRVIISLLMTGFVALSCTLNAQTKGQLIVFVQDGRSVSQDFKRHALPEIKEIAQHNDLNLKIVDASDGAPIEVAYTPAIFYREGNENILFNGRYNDVNSLSSFVESKGAVQPNTMEQNGPTALTWNIGRATMKTTMHINPLSGKPPKAKKFNAQQFEKEAMEALARGMEFFRPASAGKVDHVKSYHMEFYPEVHAREGVLLIQMELYSEFDPATPVFKTSMPSGSEWKEYEQAFQKASNRLERALIAQISNWANGDGFDTLNAPVEKWGALLDNGREPSSTTTEKGFGVLVSDKE
ncbi:MAG: hypothetical protein AAFZ15_19555 [Bacteroidota bacterium]